MRLLLVLPFLLVSCLDNPSSGLRNEEIETSSLVDLEADSSKWICYHPRTDFHNRECVEKYYPKGCYVSGDSGKFCWLLAKEDCEGEISGHVLDSCKNAGYLQ